MKYKNTQKAIVMVTGKESVYPFGVTRDFTEREVEESPELRAAISKKYLEPFEGEEVVVIPVRPKWNQAPESSEGKLVRKEVNGHVVEYIVADAVGVDGVDTTPDELVASIDGVRSIDSIEVGLDANQYTKKLEEKKAFTNAADAREAQLIRESNEAEFNDEDILADKEEERGDMLDADQEIARDVAQVLVKNHGGGHDLKDIKTVVQESTSQALDEINKATAPNPDEGEKIDGPTSNRVVQFLAKPFAAKKWDLSKEDDKVFLEEVKKYTASDNLRSLVNQRLNEIG